MKTHYEIDKRLKMLMKLNGFTIEELATKANISEDTIKSIRTGKTTNPSIYVLAAISDALSCTIDNLIGRYPKESEETNFLRKWRSLDSHGRNAIMMSIDNELSMQPAIPSKTRLFKYYTPSTYSGNGAFFDNTKPEYISIPHDYLNEADFGLVIVSESFVPDYFPNDIIAVSSKRLPHPGEAAVYQKGSIIYIRKKIIFNGVTHLIPPYAMSGEMELKNLEEYTCIGTVIGVLRNPIK